jgi:hypothetical protein
LITLAFRFEIAISSLHSALVGHMANLFGMLRAILNYLRSVFKWGSTCNR